MPSLRSAEAEPESVDALVASVEAKLRSGRRKAPLIASLVRRGWTRELASYFVNDVESSVRQELRRRALKAAAVGLIWLGAGLIATLTAYLLWGDWSNHGPLTLAWLFVVYGALRVFAGLMTAATCKPLSPLARLDRYLPRNSGLVDYQTLGVKGDATPEQIHAAYRELVKVWHPDRFAGAPELRDRAERRLKAINKAYMRLRNSSEASS